MKPKEYYRGREQTYIKHFFLERYLERVGYNIFSFSDSFVYVDGFSGPWRSSDSEYEDTSFVIALNQLTKIREVFQAQSRNVNFRCVFVEKDQSAFEKLEEAIHRFPGIEIKPIHGEFENCNSTILDYIKRDFSLVFIDPTGWTGFEFLKIAAILRHRPGEVIVNFMYDDINRHISDPRPEQAAGFRELFARDDWKAAWLDKQNGGQSREEALLSLFMEGLGKRGNFPFVTHTRILKPLANRTYFYLVYATRHVKGLVEFRRIEQQAIQEQERIRFDVKQLDDIERTGQSELFDSAQLLDTEEALKNHRSDALRMAQAELAKLYQLQDRWPYKELLGHVLIIPFVAETDVGEIVATQRKRGAISIPELKGRERKPKIGQTVVVVDRSRL